MASRGMPNAMAVRNMVFSVPPYCAISHFSQYHTKVEQLPEPEQRKVDDAAEFVLNSFRNPTLTGGMVMAIGVRGHADQDLLKSGSARLEFEQKISEERAKEVAAALIKAIKTRSMRLNITPLPAGDPFDPVIEGAGARMLLYPHAANEFQRSSNRRAEIFLLCDRSLFAHAASFDLPPQKRLKDHA
jgi:outer membrane protein OmpA-like peptidoglycan-associated protein